MPSPLIFRISNTRYDRDGYPDVLRISHCGVLEFTSPKVNEVYLPQWMMDNLELEDGGVLFVWRLSLTFVEGYSSVWPLDDWELPALHIPPVRRTSTFVFDWARGHSYSVNGFRAVSPENLCSNTKMCCLIFILYPVCVAQAGERRETELCQSPAGQIRLYTDRQSTFCVSFAVFVPY